MSTGIKKYNVCTRKTYKKGEEEKVFWPNVGTLTYFPAYGERKGGFKLELNMFPDVAFHVFEAVERGVRKDVEEKTIQMDEEEVDPADVPF
ncbi:MAG: hypothetical protein V4481_05235 [Patescibacteria group bacterium]